MIALEDGWQRLHPRTVQVTSLWVAGIAAGIAVPFVLGFASAAGLGLMLLIAAGGIVLVTGIAAVADLMRWRHTAYRVTDERVEVRYSWVLHSHRSVPRDRVRTVDLVSDPVQRMFGVAKLKIGTGQQTSESSHVTLDPVGKAEAEVLRRELLRRADSTESAESDGDEISSLSWRWIRYAPVSVTTPILGAAAFGAVMQVSEWFQLQGAVFTTVRDLFGGLSIIGLIAVLVAAAIVVGVIGSLGLFVEMWYGYSLRREDGNLVMSRGLLNTRSLTLERSRLRGVEVVEPLGVRVMRAARVDVIATGMRHRAEDENTDPKTLLPAAPFDVARRVAAEVLGSEAATATAVTGHPRAALWRRVRWGLYSVLAFTGLLAVLGLLLTDVLLHLAWILAVVLTPAAVFLAFESYRNLGHGLAEKHLVARFGVGSRRTAALLRSGVIGWTISSSPFQRRAGLVTVKATTAASRGAYPAYDVGLDDGLRFADEAVPGLLTPFLEPRR
ncbi:PH domain-containing protein [Actinophytocola algeriensis]|uniref:Putative membrane protein n=1 Tax=Actinophytocola algeriensis TaxID=1768010 RepID=A0A7W7VC51_9PSEU|nr:PH domain-containing protein [Actinophytocola algeriensis]MBB4904724.1 putative membrane protein [Actinophytocola algeriensis]MBE1476417.1 putative membrane protein [Actinophytocola algeriensis]